MPFAVLGKKQCTSRKGTNPKVKMRLTSSKSNKEPYMTVSNCRHSNPNLKYTSRKKRGRIATIQSSNNKFKRTHSPSPISSLSFHPFIT